MIKQKALSKALTTFYLLPLLASMTILPTRPAGAAAQFKAHAEVNEGSQSDGKASPVRAFRQRRLLAQATLSEQPGAEVGPQQAKYLAQQSGYPQPRAYGEQPAPYRPQAGADAEQSGAYPPPPGAYPPQPGAYAQEPGTYQPQPGVYPQQPGVYQLQPSAYPPQSSAHPLQSNPYPPGPAPYPQQQGEYAQPGGYAQPGAYPQAPGAYSLPAQPYGQPGAGTFPQGGYQIPSAYPSGPAPGPQAPYLQGRVVQAPAGLVLAISLSTAISTQVAKPGDYVQATVSQTAMLQGGDIPQGTVIEGQVSDAEAGRILNRTGRLGITFTQLRLPNGPTIPISAHLIGDIGKYALGSQGQGEVKGEGWGTKLLGIGARTGVGAGAGAALGTAMGAITGGSLGTGAWAGTAIGGGLGLAEALVLRKGRNVVVPAGTAMQLQLDQPVNLPASAAAPYTGAM